jgi:hypothetical protein
MADSPSECAGTYRAQLIQDVRTKSYVTIRNFKRILPLISAGLNLLSNYQPARPYAQVLQTLTSAASLIEDEPDVHSLVLRLRVIRARILAAKYTQMPDAELLELRIQQDIYTDLLVEMFDEQA